MLGRVNPVVGDGDVQASESERENLILRAADAAESSGFRALFSTDDDKALEVAPPFAGQVRKNVG